METDILSADHPASGNKPRYIRACFFPLQLLLFGMMCAFGVILANAQVTAVTLQSPQLSNTGTITLVSPIHIQATAEDAAPITGYVVYIDNQNAYRNFGTTVDAWITIPAGPHILYVKAWDAHGDLSTPIYQISVTGFSPPVPPIQAHRIANIDQGPWTVDNDAGVGGDCNHGSFGSFVNRSDPNTRNVPGAVQHFILNSLCAYDDSLFYRKYNQDPKQLAGDTNFLWEFWFYLPASTQSSAVQALEFDLFQALRLSDGAHEFMFGSQCNYVSNQWQFWLPQGSRLTWVDSGISPCRFSTGEWHHAVYFLQRVTSSGYQEIPQTFSASTDNNNSLRFGTLTIDGQTLYLGGVSWSTIPSPAWSPVFGVQHQLDSAMPGVLIEEYLNRESVTAW